MIQLNLMSLRHSAFYSPYLMTMAGGHLREAGFNVSYSVQSPDNLVKDNLLNGNCDISQSAVAAGFESLEKKQTDQIRHFAQINSLDGFFIADRNNNLITEREFNWNNLSGKTLLADHFFQPMAMLQYALFKKGIDPQSINIIDAGDVSQIDASFREGLGDFVHQQGPAPQQLEFEKKARVVTSVGEAVGKIAFSSLCSTQQWLNSETAKTFMGIYKHTLNQCQNNEANQIAASLQNYGFFNDINKAVLSNTIKTYQTLGCWNHNGSIGHEEYEKLLDVFEYNHLITQRHPYEALIKSIT
ncbi:MAG: hypothetical protein OQK98_06600 [Gammaproteobacteria bacterium]|nr:hypothetical protein [Gammaproteobacteria bacterium]